MGKDVMQQDMYIVTDEGVLNVLEEAKQYVGVKGDISVYAYKWAKSPSMTGVFNRKIILPESDIRENDLKKIFIQELMEHKKRKRMRKSFAAVAAVLVFVSVLALTIGMWRDGTQSDRTMIIELPSLAGAVNIFPSHDGYIHYNVGGNVFEIDIEKDEDTSRILFERDGFWGMRGPNNIYIPSSYTNVFISGSNNTISVNELDTNLHINVGYSNVNIKLPYDYSKNMVINSSFSTNSINTSRADNIMFTVSDSLSVIRFDSDVVFVEEVDNVRTYVKGEPTANIDIDLRYSALVTGNGNFITNTGHIIQDFISGLFSGGDDAADMGITYEYREERGLLDLSDFDISGFDLPDFDVSDFLRSLSDSVAVIAESYANYMDAIVDNMPEHLDGLSESLEILFGYFPVQAE